MSGLEVLALGAAAGGAGATATAATAGLFGAGGAFSLGATLGTVGSVAGAMGALQSGSADKNAANYNAQAARSDAASKEAAQRVNAQRQLGSIRANLGKSGATTAGTPLMVLAESASNAEIDALNTRRTGTVESDIYTARGKNARAAGNLRAGTSLLSGMSRIF